MRNSETLGFNTLKVIDFCVQVFGGRGYMTEYRVSRARIEVRVAKIWAGSNAVMKEPIGRDLGLQPLSAPFHIHVQSQGR
ncbi:acyl-CoA dehydrogenase family protein [Streptomyces sp. NPDC127051]|uniref:acyl-CoA dehydrogenase family protein n=1 Tax=Streptomyces sp. NPDC127051 TaxID=3347119 RepID=UPI003664DD65